MSSLFFDTASAASFRPDKMNKVNLYESHRLFCDVYCLEAGQAQHPHTHDDNDKIYHVLSGRCDVRIADEVRTLTPGQGAVAPAGIPHGVENRSDARVTLLVMMAPHPKFVSKPSNS